MSSYHVPIPATWPVQPLKPGTKAKDKVTCGHCRLSWDDAIITAYTPAPSGRCPFEEFHVYHDEEAAQQKYQLSDRELATILAALRNLQAPYTHTELRSIATNDDTFLPLTNAEIDELCERLNCSKPAPPVCAKCGKPALVDLGDGEGVFPSACREGRCRRRRKK